MKKLLTIAAMAEVVTGMALIVVPSLIVRLLFGADIAGIGVVTSRFAGLALIALGVATLGLLNFALSGKWNGPLLWPAVVLHAVLTLLLARAWFKPQENGSA
jgi:hypothetical protein